MSRTFYYSYLLLLLSDNFSLLCQKLTMSNIGTYNYNQHLNREYPEPSNQILVFYNADETYYNTVVQIFTECALDYVG